MYEKVCVRCDKIIDENEKMWIDEDGDFAHDDCIGWDDLNEWESYNFDYVKGQ